MDNQQTCIILCGNIGCGKTTVADYLMQNHLDEKIVTICNDGIITMCHNGNYQGYKPTLQGMYKDMFKRCLCAAIDAGCDVICDNMHETEIKRREIFAIAKAADMRVVGIDLGPGSPETLKRRQDADDGRDIPDSTWAMVHQRTAEKYQPMDIDEGFDEIITREEIEEVMYG